MLELAIKGSKRYYGWMTFLLVIIGVGFLLYLRQLDFGLGITGLSRDTSWGFYIANFTFLVGVAAGGVMVVLPYYLHDYKAFGKVTILGEFLAIASVLMCVTFILVDLGQPMRILNVFLYPSPKSVLSTTASLFISPPAVKYLAASLLFEGDALPSSMSWACWRRATPTKPC